MSITSLVDEEIIRTEQAVLRQRSKPIVDAFLPQIVLKHSIAANDVITLADDLLPLAASSSKETTSTSASLDSLARYIPTESITLYVAASSAMPALKQTFPSLSEGGVYWTFGLVLTPALFLLILVGKRRSERLSALPAVGKLPWWKVVAATVAFLVWALAIPTTPYLTGESGKIVAAFGAVLISTFLTLLEPIFEGKATVAGP